MTRIDYRSGFLAVGLLVLLMALQVAVLDPGFSWADVTRAGTTGAVALGLAYGIERLASER